jgi:hypothetical protein
MVINGDIAGDYYILMILNHLEEPFYVSVAINR